MELCPQCKGTQLQPERLVRGLRRKWCKRCKGKGWCKPFKPIAAKVKP